MRVLEPTHANIYTCRERMQAFSPDFMRVFKSSAVEICMDSGSASLDACSARILRLSQPVETQHGVSLLELSLPAQRAELITGIEVLIMFGNHNAFRPDDLRL
jgi:hypothetical protein